MTFNEAIDAFNNDRKVKFSTSIGSVTSIDSIDESVYIMWENNPTWNGWYWKQKRNSNSIYNLDNIELI